MNKFKSLVAVSAIFLTATMASAQTVEVGPGYSGVADHTHNAGVITFSVEVHEMANIWVNGSVPELNETNIFIPAHTAALALTNIAGTIDVETNLALWDVVLEAKNGGKLKNGTNNLKVLTGTTPSDANIDVYACWGKKDYTTAASSACDAAAANFGPKKALTTGKINISSLLKVQDGKVGGFTNSDVDAITKYAHFVILAAIDAKPENAAGSGIYTEEITATLVSKY